MDVSFSGFYEANGPFFFFGFLLLSMIALALVIYRYVCNYFQPTAGLDTFIDQFVDQIPSGADATRQSCADAKGVYVPLFVTALNCAANGKGKVAACEAIANTIQYELLPSLTRPLTWILFIAKIAPMFGLFGTVCGMIAAFSKIGEAGAKVDPAVLSTSIGMALFTTAEGLVLAIATLWAYTHLRQVVHVYEIHLQRGAQAALELVPVMSNTFKSQQMPGR